MTHGGSGPVTEIALRCYGPGTYQERCEDFLGTSAIPMQLVAVFKASAAIRVPKMDLQERRRRCRHCGHVNVFRPLTLASLSPMV
jgi:hypothetical protein